MRSHLTELSSTSTAEYYEAKMLPKRPDKVTKSLYEDTKIIIATDKGPTNNVQHLFLIYTLTI